MRTMVAISCWGKQLDASVKWFKYGRKNTGIVVVVVVVTVMFFEDLVIV